MFQTILITFNPVQDFKLLDQALADLQKEYPDVLLLHSSKEVTKLKNLFPFQLTFEKKEKTDQERLGYMAKKLNAVAYVIGDPNPEVLEEVELLNRHQVPVLYKKLAEPPAKV